MKNLPQTKSQDYLQSITNNPGFFVCVAIDLYLLIAGRGHIFLILQTFYGSFSKRKNVTLCNATFFTEICAFVLLEVMSANYVACIAKGCLYVKADRFLRKSNNQQRLCENPEFNFLSRTKKALIISALL